MQTIVIMIAVMSMIRATAEQAMPKSIRRDQIVARAHRIMLTLTKRIERPPVTSFRIARAFSKIGNSSSGRKGHNAARKQEQSLVRPNAMQEASHYLPSPAAAAGILGAAVAHLGAW